MALTNFQQEAMSTSNPPQQPPRPKPVFSEPVLIEIFTNFMCSLNNVISNQLPDKADAVKSDLTQLKTQLDTGELKTNRFTPTCKEVLAAHLGPEYTSVYNEAKLRVDRHLALQHAARTQQQLLSFQYTLGPPPLALDVALLNATTLRVGCEYQEGGKLRRMKEIANQSPLPAPTQPPPVYRAAGSMQQSRGKVLRRVGELRGDQVVPNMVGPVPNIRSGGHAAFNLKRKRDVSGRDGRSVNTSWRTVSKLFKDLDDAGAALKGYIQDVVHNSNSDKLARMRYTHGSESRVDRSKQMEGIVDIYDDVELIEAAEIAAVGGSEDSVLSLEKQLQVALERSVEAEKQLAELTERLKKNNERLVEKDKEASERSVEAEKQVALLTERLIEKDNQLIEKDVVLADAEKRIKEAVEREEVERAQAIKAEKLLFEWQDRARK